MKKIQSHTMGIERGSLLLFSDFQDGGAMWTGQGPRELRRVINFSEEFASAPIVHVSMSMWDMDQQHNNRADISSEAVGRSGFVIVFRTWGDTRVARVRADWLAIGELPDPDMWDLD